MAKKPTATSEAQKTAYYDALIRRKVVAGLTLEQATDVTARQREEDDANGIDLDVTAESSNLTEPPTT